MTILFNPKRFNGKPSAPVRDVFMNKVYELKVNELKKFDPQVAKYLTTKFGFIQVVAPESVPGIQKSMTAGDFICEHCNKEFDSEKALSMHKLGQHKMSKENQELLDSVPSAEPVGEVRPRTKKKHAISPEEQAGIPSADGSYDGDGVQWVGAGLETDSASDMKSKIPGVSKGVFGG